MRLSLSFCFFTALELALHNVNHGCWRSERGTSFTGVLFVDEELAAFGILFTRGFWGIFFTFGFFGMGFGGSWGLDLARLQHHLGLGIRGHQEDCALCLRGRSCGQPGALLEVLFSH